MSLSDLRALEKQAQMFELPWETLVQRNYWGTRMTSRKILRHPPHSEPVPANTLRTVLEMEYTPVGPEPGLQPCLLGGPGVRASPLS